MNDTAPPAARSPFAFPAYRSLWVANLACNAAVLIQSVGASWSLVEHGASPQVVALVQTALSLPLMLMSPLSGAISDRIDRRLVMLGAQFLMGLVAILLVVLEQTGNNSAPLILGCMFLSGCSLAFNGPAFMSSIADTVPRERLPDAVLTNAIGLNLARSVGPATGGILLAAAGVAINYLVAAALALGLVLLLWRWRPTYPAVDQPTGVGEKLIGAIGEGFRFAMATPPVKAALIRTGLFTGAFSIIQALMPLIASKLLSGGPDLYGFLFGCFGVGALVGALAGTRLRRMTTHEGLVRLCIVVLSVTGLVVALSTSVAISAIAVGLAGGAWVVALAIFNTTIQLGSPRRIGGRTLSIYQMSVFAGVAGGSWIGGLIADGFGTAAALLAMAAIGALTLAAGFVLPIAEPAENSA